MPTAQELSRLAKMSRNMKVDDSPRENGGYVARELRRRLGPTVVRDVVSRYQEGEHSTDLCQEYGVSKTGLVDLLRDEGIEIRKQPITEALSKLAAGLYESGMSIAEVVEQVWDQLHHSAEGPAPKRYGYEAKGHQAI